jgi:predicted esterase
MTHGNARSLATALGVLALIAAACGSPSDAATTIPERTTEAPTTTEAPLPYEVTGDLVYHDGDDRFIDDEGLINVVAPIAEGPWPVVVAFHGNPRGVDKAWMMPTARAIARQNRVVFVPTWGSVSGTFQRDASLEEEFDLLVREIQCAVLFAKDRAAEYGGDPNHITVYGYSAGGNAALMAGFGHADPLETCAANGDAVQPQAIVNGDGDVLLGAATWDDELDAEPDAFYALTPWRRVDGSHEFKVVVAAVENTTSPYERQLGDDPYASALATRHVDIDLVASMTAMGFLDDGVFSNRDANEWAYLTLLEAGYDVELVILPDSNHDSISLEGEALLIDTIVNAEG